MAGAMAREGWRAAGLGSSLEQAARKRLGELGSEAHGSLPAETAGIPAESLPMPYTWGGAGFAPLVAGRALLDSGAMQWRRRVGGGTGGWPSAPSPQGGRLHTALSCHSGRSLQSWRVHVHMHVHACLRVLHVHVCMCVRVCVCTCVCTCVCGGGQLHTDLPPEPSSRARAMVPVGLGSRLAGGLQEATGRTPGGTVYKLRAP